MADYDPLIPQANDLISQSQADILNNFGQLESIFNTDHWTWDSTPSANRGLHRQISFPAALGSDPSLGSNVGYLFLKNDPNDTASKPQLYFKNSSNTYQVSNRFRSSGTTGYWMADNGSGTTGSTMITMWGSASIPSSPTSGQVPVAFPTMSNYTGAPIGFPNNLYNVQFSVQCTSSNNQPSVCIDTSGFSTTGFTIRYSSGGTAATVYWTAIGN
jgi:hypothetical protein